MAENLILCGGTGAHVGAAFLRLHTLGHALGYFQTRDGAPRLPDVYILDQDDGNGTEGAETAHQLVRRLLDEHPARHDWVGHEVRRANHDVEAATIRPLPIGPHPSQPWYEERSGMRERFGHSLLFELVAQGWQQDIEYHKGMMASPAIGSLLFRLKAFDTHDQRNRDSKYHELVRNRAGRSVVIGSGVGGTGSSVGPTFANELADHDHKVMAIMLLNWFTFTDAELPEDQEAASARARILDQNASSAFAFYGADLYSKVAALPLGLPRAARARRSWAGDMQQPIEEHYIHAVGAVAAFHHLCDDDPMGPDLYVAGAHEATGIAPGTPIPGGTLQDLANRATSWASALRAVSRALQVSHGSLAPAIVTRLADSGFTHEEIARSLDQLAAHVEEQLQWMDHVLGIQGEATASLDLEASWRARLRSNPLAWRASDRVRATDVAAAVSRWITEWLVDVARSGRDDRLTTARLTRSEALYWPDVVADDAHNVAPGAPCVPTRVEQVAGVLDRFVDADRLSVNGWPYPVATAGYFREAIGRGDPRARRQLELLLVGLTTGKLRLDPLRDGERPTNPLSLEQIFYDLDHRGVEPGLASHRVCSRDGRTTFAMTAPNTLLCPVPDIEGAHGMHDAWQSLFEELTGLGGRHSWHEVGEETHVNAWSRNRDTAKVVRKWVQDLLGQWGPDEAPPWTGVFSSVQAGNPTYYQVPHKVRVNWAARPQNASNRARQSISLPSLSSDHRVAREKYKQSAPWRDLRAHLGGSTGQPDTFDVVDKGGERFARFRARLVEPNPAETWWIWREHLDALRDASHILAWAALSLEDGSTGVGIEWRTEGGDIHQTVMEDTRLARIDDITVPRVRPLGQDRLRESDFRLDDLAMQEARPDVDSAVMPQVPIRARYLPFLALDDGTRVVDHLLAEPKRVWTDAQWRPQIRRSESKAVWSLRFQGRNKPQTHEATVEGPWPDAASPEFTQQAARAHVMVWPRFRVFGPRPWRAYYVGFEFSDRRLRADCVWMDDRKNLRTLDIDGIKGRTGVSPVAFKAGQHEGGPPLAITLFEGDEERGLLWVPLERRNESATGARVAVDFGTSHSALAWSSTDGGPSEPLLLGPDLQHRHVDDATTTVSGQEVPSRSFGLTLHVVESHKVMREVVLGQGIWFPTYAAGGNGWLTSELMLTGRKSELISRAEQWTPAIDFQIAPFLAGGSEVGGSARRSEHLITDFKWQASEKDLQGRESLLRRHYLALLLEMGTAALVDQRQARPKDIDMTCMWSLRSDEAQVQAYEEDCREIARRVSTATGTDIELKGLYNESEAARVTPGDGRLVLVADLGGGTLDIFLSVDDRHESRHRKVVDSVRLGGNVLLDRLAAGADRYLPANSAWSSEVASTSLRSWMRVLGADRLYGMAEGEFRIQSLDLVGYRPGDPDDKARRESARKLVYRYFRLISEYLARYLAAYTLDGGLLDDQGRVRLGEIILQLRGNGWRLHPRSGSGDRHLEGVAEEMRADIERRLIELLERPELGLAETTPFHQAEPKFEPVKQAVGKQETWRLTLRNSESHTLVDLARAGAGDDIPWTSRVPLDTEGRTDLELPDAAIRPPIPLTEPGASVADAVGGDLPPDVTNRINVRLTEGSVDRNAYTVRVPRFVWEELFGCGRFEKGL